MTTMTTKQALQVLTHNLFDLAINPYADKNLEEKNEALNIIEIAIEDYDNLKETVDLLTKLNESTRKESIDRWEQIKEYAYKYCQASQENEKLKNALGLLRDKGVNTEALKLCTDVDEYNEHCYNDILTEEEFALLKEIICNKKN